jgi:hypothetical protein
MVFFIGYLRPLRIREDKKEAEIFWLRHGRDIDLVGFWEMPV